MTSGVVTGLKCALDARASGGLKALTSCPPAEAAKEIVVFDVAEKRSTGWGEEGLPVAAREPFGGGSIDFEGKTVKVDKKNDIATVEVAQFSVTKKPKAGAFKGCRDGSGGLDGGGPAVPAATPPARATARRSPATSYSSRAARAVWARRSSP